MLNSIKGIVTAITQQSVTMQVGPVGVSVLVSSPSDFALKEEKTVSVYMHWNSEQGPSLYGFISELDKSVFLIITSASGIGPKIGLAVLHDIGAESFLDAVQSGDDRILSKVSGIGTKKAEQMIVQLKHKVSQLISSGVSLDQTSSAVEWHTLAEALQALNYSRNEVSNATNYLRTSGASSQTFDQLLRQALSFLSKQS